MNDTLAGQAEELARLASLIRTGLAEAESTIPTINELLAELADLWIPHFEIEGSSIYCRVAGMSGAATVMGPRSWPPRPGYLIADRRIALHQGD